MANQSYGLFCPISKACEVLEPRWTLLVLVEMFCGASRFNDIGRGLPGMSPTLLSKRLKDMQQNGLVVRNEHPETGQITYALTESARELKPVAMTLGKWAEKYVETEVHTDDLDPKLLMWNLKRTLNASFFQAARTVVQFIFPEVAEDERNFWLIARDGIHVDLCITDPGFEVDLFVTANLKSLTSIYLGHQKLNAAIENDEINLVGNKALRDSINRWLLLNPLAYM